ncbi:hypothetical protein SEVIR_3G372000v4 [Setaria viridis]|uniref:Uncharacterized protein n=1 Tax=Setaria viridis TaxID=4556 RepID=A0A4V6DAC3_SETVI|nr:hypothetical protein SEVIR_3G372000v2 [Setaria viridis]
MFFFGGAGVRWICSGGSDLMQPQAIPTRAFGSPERILSLFWCGRGDLLFFPARVSFSGASMSSSMAMDCSFSWQLVACWRRISSASALVGGTADGWLLRSMCHGCSKVWAAAAFPMSWSPSA